MPNGIIKEEFLKQALNTGFDSYEAVLVAKNTVNPNIASQAITFNAVQSNSTSIPQVVLSIPGSTTVTKLELQSTGGQVLWELEETYEFIVPGSLTVDIQFTLQMTGQNNSTFLQGVDNYILTNGLATKSLLLYYMQPGPLTHTTSSGTMGNIGSISSSDEQATISLASSTVANITGPVDITEIRIFVFGPNKELINLSFTENPYSFERNGTLTFNGPNFIITA